MRLLFDAVRREVFDQIRAALPEVPAGELVVETPPDPKMGDFGFPTFRLAKQLRKAPPAIAVGLAEKLSASASLTRLCKVSALGPYVNFSVHPEILVGEILPEILLSGAALAAKPVPSNAPVAVMEFSSPNIAKPFNIYHLRSTMIGNCLNRVLAARGFKTIALNHLGDWGTQYGTLATAFALWGDESELSSRGIEYLVELYVRINKAIETDPSLEEKAREAFSKLEKGDPQIRALWKKFVDLSLEEFRKTYARLNVRFDHFWGESFYIDKVAELERLLQDRKLLVASEGAMVVPLETWSMPPCIVRKQDGSTIYATRDLAAALYRHEQFRFERMIYVVGGEQKLHFAQVFKVLELAGLDWAKSCTHIDFGLYRFKDAKMSTRKGNFVTMEAVLDHAVERVTEIMSAKAAELRLSADEVTRNAEAIGVGAIVFNDLATDRNSDVNFDLERVLDFEGETGPYVQYAHTRCLSILRNAPRELVDGVFARDQLLDLNSAHPDLSKATEAAKARLGQTEELDLIRTLGRLPLILDLVIETYRPHHLANYLIDITKSFNAFYRAHKVLVEDVDLARARLGLVLATQRTLLQGMTLLGMRAPERM